MNESNPLVAVCIPIYNVEKYVERCLTSVFAQDYTNIELLVYYDQSDDDTLEKTKKVIKKGRFAARIIEKEYSEKGQGLSRNMAIIDAKGTYLYFLDADDYIEPNAISTLVRHAVRFDADLVVGSHDIHYEDGTRTVSVEHEDKTFLDNESFMSYVYVSNSYYSQYAWNKLYRTSFLRENNIRCIHKIVEDYIFSFEVIRHAVRVVLVKDVLLHYLVRSSSTTNLNMAKKVTKETADIYLSIRDYVLHVLDAAKESPVTENIKMEVLYFSFVMTVRNSLNSSEISKEGKRVLCDEISRFPNLPACYKNSLLEKRKSYRTLFVILSRIPFRLRRRIIFMISKMVELKNIKK